MNDLINKHSQLPAFGTLADESDGRDGECSTVSSSDLTNIVAAEGGNGPPRDCSAPTLAEVTSSGFETAEGTMSQYRVGFYNETSDSTGHDHHVCQHELGVTALGTDEAIAGAIVEFEEHQDVSTWRDRANSIECVQTGGKA